MEVVDNFWTAKIQPKNAGLTIYTGLIFYFTIMKKAALRAAFFVYCSPTDAIHHGFREEVSLLQTVLLVFLQPPLLPHQGHLALC